ncbi:hypothetical protein GCM10007103_25910 [Salinimicrobium marinum]|uniref:Tyr recombinase domain-containing protein n=2 Tax=Salinimicrobium marinum TaxID=680283 RepID=A0A918SJS9_9FLAO|nr:hypothetical protein GCM10007103_25910 [Salinimicrobium marinum]
MIRIHDGGTTPRYKTTGYKIKEKDWNKNAKADRKNWVRTTADNYDLINDKIDQMLGELKAELEGTSDTKILQQTRNTRKGSKRSYLKYTKTYISLTRNQATRINLEQGIKKLYKYLEEIDQLYLTFDDITRNFCKGYYNYLLDSYSTASTNQYFGVFRTIYNDAVGDDSLNIQIPISPFKDFKYSKNKTTNTPLTPDEFEDLKYTPTPKRNWEITKNIFLFQFSNAFRINEVMLLKWGDINYRNNEFLIDKHTSKTTIRVFRNISLEVVELLVPGIERYFPRVREKLEKINQNVEQMKEDLKIKQQCPPKPLTPEDMLLKLSEGVTNDQLRKELNEVKSYESTIKDYQKEIDSHDFSKRLLLRKYIIELNQNHPDNFVWDKPDLESIDINRMNADDYAAYKRCVGSNDGYLKRLQKEAGINTKLSSHVARYTASQFMFNSGMDFNQISQFLTHTSHGTTEKYVNRLGVNSNELSNYLTTFIK